MLNKLILENFKCFTKAHLELAPLTVLTGLNSSGKSSVLQAIRMLEKQDKLIGHGNCISANGNQANISVYHSKDNINNILNISRFEEREIVSSILQNEKSRRLLTAHLDYISADRLGPQSFLPLQQTRKIIVGEKGEYTLSLINYYRENGGVPEKLRFTNLATTSSVFEQIKAWLAIISPGIELALFPQPLTDTIGSTFATYRAKDVGFGLSYALPIIASVIINSAEINSGNKEFATILIENPEAHLHPRGQTQMGKFLALAAECGVQVIIETHSEHIINGIRLAIKDKHLDFEKALIYYFEYSPKEEKSIYTPIFIDEYAMLDNWPEGFFDETEKSLLRLL